MLEGKGIYAWILRRIEGGDMKKVVERMQWAGMTHIIPKIADGITTDLNGNWNYLPDLVKYAHRAGIKVLGYQYIYGYNPSVEADRAILELKRLPFDGFVINAEHQYRDITGNDARARTYCARIRDAFPDLWIALSSYRFPSYHRNFPFEAFLAFCNANLPQVYWMQANGTVPRQLDRTLREYEPLPTRTLIPTGAAFQEHGWVANAQDQKIFVDEVTRHNLSACNWWEYHHTFHQLPHLGEAIANAGFNVDPVIPEPDPEPSEKRYRILFTGNALSIRSGPGAGFGLTGHYVRNGEVQYSDREENNWYYIVRNGVRGWISGNTQWTQITVLEPEPDPEPEPEPEPEKTLKERVAWLEKFVRKILESLGMD